MQVVGYGPVGHELVDEEKIAAVAGGAAIEADKVLVAERGEDVDLIHELLHSLVVVLVQALYSNYPTVS